MKRLLEHCRCSKNYRMRSEVFELMRLLLNEAVGREEHADELAEIATWNPMAVYEAVLRRQAHGQRIRAMLLRSQAAALSEQYGFSVHAGD